LDKWTWGRQKSDNQKGQKAKYKKGKKAEKLSQTLNQAKQQTNKAAKKAALAARQPNDWQANPPPQTSATRTCTSAVVGGEATGNNSGSECSTA
jgi:hypothetical protein